MIQHNLLNLSAINITSMRTSLSPLETILTNSFKEEMISYITSHQDEFGELIELAVSDKQPYSWRAAWLLWSCMDNNDLRVKAHVSTIVKHLNLFKDGQQRNLINILQKMEVPEDSEALLFDSCVDIWLNIEKQSSVRYKSFEVIVHLAKRYPELNNEVKSLTDTRFVEPLSEGIKRSFYKLIR